MIPVCRRPPSNCARNRKRAGLWQIDQNVEALGHRDREAIARHRLQGMAIGCDHAADDFAEIDPELARGRALMMRSRTRPPAPKRE